MIISSKVIFLKKIHLELTPFGWKAVWRPTPKYHPEHMPCLMSLAATPEEAWKETNAGATQFLLDSRFRPPIELNGRYRKKKDILKALGRG